MAFSPRPTGLVALFALPSALPVRRWLERRPVVLVSTVVLFAAIFALRQSSTSAAAATDLLYVVPIALGALELGIVVGLASAVLAIGLVGIWALTAYPDLPLAGLAVRGLVFLAVGSVAGRFSNRMREAQASQERLLESGLDLAHLASAENLPGTVARHAQAVAGARGARVELADQVPAESGVATGALVRVPIELRGARIGTLSVTPSSAWALDDRAALAILALQAAVATENQRLLVSERQRAALQGQLHAARCRLTELGAQLRVVFDGQESERCQIAYELQEQVAQTLAAVLLGLNLLERDVGSNVTPRVGVLRSHLDATLAALRKLAVDLRPPVLDLGLPVALERLGESARMRGLERMTVALDGAADHLPPEVEITVYRVVQEALRAFGGACSGLVTTEPGERSLTVVLSRREGDRSRIDREQLAIVRARLDSLEGKLEVSDTELRALIPLPDREAQPTGEIRSGP